MLPPARGVSLGSPAAAPYAPFPVEDRHRDAPAFAVLGRTPWGAMVFPWHLYALRLARDHATAYVAKPVRPFDRRARAAAAGAPPPGLPVVVPVDFPLQRFPPVRRACAGHAARAVRRALRRPAGPLVVLFFPRSDLGLVRALRPDLAAYLVTDDFSRTDHGRGGPDAPFLEWQEEACALAGLVLPITGAFVERLGSVDPARIVVLPPAVDGEAFDGRPRPPHGALEGLPRPLLGYAGTVRASRLDVPAVAALAARRPDLGFAFVGPRIEEGGHDLAPLRGRANVRFVDCPSFAAVSGYVASFDLVFVPYREGQGNSGFHPLKVLDGLAMGKPAVVSPGPGTAEFHPFVRFAGGVDGLEEAVDGAAALLREPGTAGRIRASVRGHEYSDRVARLLAEAGARLPPRGRGR